MTRTARGSNRYPVETVFAEYRTKKILRSETGAKARKHTDHEHEVKGAGNRAKTANEQRLEDLHNELITRMTRQILMDAEQALALGDAQTRKDVRRLRGELHRCMDLVQYDKQTNLGKVTVMGDVNDVMSPAIGVLLEYLQKWKLAQHVKHTRESV